VEKLSQQIKVTLERVKAAAALTATALFDDDRGELAGASEPSPSAFWGVLEVLPCLEVDWDEWYRTLRGEGSRTVSCACEEEHAVKAQLVGRRFVLLTVSTGPLVSAGPWAAAAAIAFLSTVLPPPLRRSRKPPHGGEPEAARVGIPLWWLRRWQA
jgi:hypothetical protein